MKGEKCMIEKIKAAANFIKERFDKKIDLAIILGSGLGELAEKVKKPVIIPYNQIPDFPVSTITGHKGRLVIGELKEKTVLCMQGRIHYYEGYDMKKVIFPIYVIRSLGIEKLIITNAAGGTSYDYAPGDLMLITGHINNTGVDPLRGDNLDEFGPRFPDLTTVYNKEFIKLTEEVAKELKIEIKKGIYCGNSGPTYESPAEIKMMKSWGANAVGMSTVPEVIAAAHCGMKVLGISCITNFAAGITDKPLTHDEVIETTNQTKNKFIKLISEVIKRI